MWLIHISIFIHISWRHVATKDSHETEADAGPKHKTKPKPNVVYALWKGLIIGIFHHKNTSQMQNAAMLSPREFSSASAGLYVTSIAQFPHEHQNPPPHYIFLMNHNQLRSKYFTLQQDSPLALLSPAGSNSTPYCLCLYTMSFSCAFLLFFSLLALEEMYVVLQLFLRLNC